MTDRRRQSRPREAFTLVESLVVVSLVAMLLAIVVPTVGRSARLAERATCTSALRAMAGGLTGYAADRAGSLPGGVRYRVWWGGPSELYRRGADPRLGAWDGWFGVGALWRGGYVSTGEAFYCPAAERAGEWDYAHGWPRKTDGDGNPPPDKRIIYGSYAYRGGLEAEGHGPSLRLTGLSGGSALVADNPTDGRMWHEGGYNVACADGGVRFVDFGVPPVAGGDPRAFWTRAGRVADAPGRSRDGQER
jgi:prepilin-type N-terminal cleavage/methylation domain-containing protein